MEEKEGVRAKAKRRHRSRNTKRTKSIWKRPESDAQNKI